MKLQSSDREDQNDQRRRNHFVLRIRQAALDQPRASRHSASVRLRQGNIGGSRQGEQLAFASRNSRKRSRKSAGFSASKATTKTRSSQPKEKNVCRRTQRSFHPMRT